VSNLNLPAHRTDNLSGATSIYPSSGIATHRSRETRAPCAIQYSSPGPGRNPGFSPCCGSATSTNSPCRNSYRRLESGIRSNSANVTGILQSTPTTTLLPTPRSPQNSTTATTAAPTRRHTPPEPHTPPRTPDASTSTQARPYQPPASVRRHARATPDATTPAPKPRPALPPAPLPQTGYSLPPKHGLRHSRIFQRRHVPRHLPLIRMIRRSHPHNRTHRNHMRQRRTPPRHFENRRIVLPPQHSQSIELPWIMHRFPELRAPRPHYAHRAHPIRLQP
jgi:hypothetical protein